MLICPVCEQKLEQHGASYRCEAGHLFDLAKEGYVNLLPANQTHSHHPGDTKEMVQSRRAFLEKGYYAPFAASLYETARTALAGKRAPALLDIGCGEGYYTAWLKKAAHPASPVLGVDISKWAVRQAAKQNKDCTFAVGSAFRLPVASQSVDLAVNLFAPLATEEVVRVLKEDGIFLYGIPGPQHLYGLKEILYDHPYENETKHTEYEGLCFLNRVTVTDTLHLTDPADIKALFAMTPYYWKTPKEGAQRLEGCRELSTQIHFDFLLYQKIKL